MQKPENNNKDERNKDEEIVPQTQWNLMWKKFKRHKVAMFSILILFIFYIVGVMFPGFFAPYDPYERFEGTYVPPQSVHFFTQEGTFHLRPFVYQWEQEMDPDTWALTFKQNKSKKFPIHFFVRGHKYKMLGIINTDLHFFGIKDGNSAFLFGTDRLGRDLFSRIIFACRISLTIGFAGVFISLIMGLIFGGISGYFGGAIDDIIQRIIETLMALPKIPLWMALAAAVPQNWSPVQVYFAITIILSLLGWTGLARVIRSKFISLREEEFVDAAVSFNASEATIIGRHLIPNFISYVIVNLTLAIPAMIIGETALSFLGIGLRPPVISLGVLLKRAQSFKTVSMHPWLLIPGIFVIIVVLSFNFVGDGLRDAADPYQFI